MATNHHPMPHAHSWYEHPSFGSRTNCALASLLAKVGPGIRFNEHLDYDDGAAVFHHACKMGLEGIVSKRKDSPYRSGRSPDWLKMKNPACEAVKREAEEDWGKERRR